VLTPRGRALLTGLDRADSLVVDPRKWLFQPYDVACVLVRRPGALTRTFAMSPEYLAAVSSTVLDGRTVLRLCTINPRTLPRDIEVTVASWPATSRSGPRECRFREAVARNCQSRRKSDEPDSSVGVTHAVVIPVRRYEAVSGQARSGQVQLRAERAAQ
jgi:hypothetical protein